VRVSNPASSLFLELTLTVSVSASLRSIPFALLEAKGLSLGALWSLDDGSLCLGHPANFVFEPLCLSFGRCDCHPAASEPVVGWPRNTRLVAALPQ
jgi:hypothetical protein